MLGNVVRGRGGGGPGGGGLWGCGARARPRPFPAPGRGAAPAGCAGFRRAGRAQPAGAPGSLPRGSARAALPVAHPHTRGSSQGGLPARAALLFGLPGSSVRKQAQSELLRLGSCAEPSPSGSDVGVSPTWTLAPAICPSLSLLPCSLRGSSLLRGPFSLQRSSDRPALLCCFVDSSLKKCSAEVAGPLWLILQ